MGFMTKGFLAWLLPVLIGVPFALWQRRIKEMLCYGPLAIVLAIAVCLPWALMIHHQEPDFWQFFFWNEHIRRFSASDAQHIQPWWFYLPLLLAASLPWATLLPAALFDAWKQKRQPGIAFLLLWVLLPLAMFSLSKGKLPTYILPCLLPLALLMGHALISWIDQAPGPVRPTRFLPLSLLADPLLRFAMLIYLCVPGMFIGVNVVGMYYLQRVTGMAPGAIGALMVPWSLASFAAMMKGNLNVAL